MAEIRNYNKVPIDHENAKYQTIRLNGICQLKFRRALFGDGGIYSCVAENELGTDSVSSEVIVRNPEEKGKLHLKEEILV